MFPGLHTFLAQHFPMLFPTRTITGTRYPFVVEVEGADLVVRNIMATWFGGASDPQDDGETASGISTRANPWLVGCALPMDNGKPLGPKNPCQGSPLPEIPWGTPIEALNNDNGIAITAKLIDRGPSAPPKAHAALDLTAPGFINLGGKLGEGALPNITFRIKGGAKFLKS